MQRLEVSGAVRPIYGSLGVKRLMSRSLDSSIIIVTNLQAGLSEVRTPQEGKGIYIFCNTLGQF